MYGKRAPNQNGNGNTCYKTGGFSYRLQIQKSKLPLILGGVLLHFLLVKDHYYQGMSNGKLSIGTRRSLRSISPSPQVDVQRAGRE